MPDAVVFPEMLLREQSHEWNRAGTSAMPGPTASGVYPLVRLDGGGRWEASLNEIVFRGMEYVLCWRAIRTLANGGSTPIVVPRAEKSFAPFPVVGGRRLTSYRPIPHSDGSFHSDGSGYYQPVIIAETAGTAALRAISLVIHFTYGGPLLGGEVFSINHEIEGWRMYEIGSVVVNGDGDSVVTFLPPLREATTDATPIEFDKPRCTMRLRDPNAMNLRVEPFPFGRPGVSFVETFFNT